MESQSTSYTQDDLEVDFNLFLAAGMEQVPDNLKEITDLRNMENTLHDLGSYIATIIQQFLISRQSKYKLIHDKTLDLQLSELFLAYPEHKEIIESMKAYKSKIDDIILKTATVFGLAMDTWD